MSNTRSLTSFFVVLAVSSSLAMVGAGCERAPLELRPDAVSVVPLDPTGMYEIRSRYSLAAAPPVAAPMLAELGGATDGPDDPSRYLIDRLVARVPEGRVQVLAAAVAPYLAAYVQARIDSFAPELAIGVHEIAVGLGQIARRFGTMEELTIGHDGRARRRIVGLSFEPRSTAVDASLVEVALAPLGLSDIAAVGNFALAEDHLTIGEHGATLPYGALLRVGLDRAVIPRVVDGARSLDEALVALVNCGRLGELVAEYVGLGEPELYARACGAALRHVASEIYEGLAAMPDVRLVVAGKATVIDLDGDGPGDVITAGTWVGTVGDAPIAFSVFDGATP